MIVTETCSFEASIGEGEVRRFADLSGDFNPLHLDADYARRTEFERPIAHGALLIGQVSRVLGMHIPGTRSLILSMKVRFPKPLYYPATVLVSGNLHSFDNARETGTVHVRIVESSSGSTVLEAEVQFTLHSSERVTEHRTSSEVFPSPGSRTSLTRQILVTGGTGGLGAAICAELVGNYQLVVVTRNPPHPHSESIRYELIDLERQGELEAFLDSRAPSEFSAILHMSSAPLVRGPIIHSLPEVRRQMRHAVEVPILLTQWATLDESAVRRIVLVGSIAGTRLPDIQHPSYSLAKASMEHLVRFLAAETTSLKATVNVVLPGAMSSGMNRGMLDRQRKSIAARTATGRMVEPKDVADVVAFLLSDRAGQINGSSIVVDGGYQG